MHNHSESCESCRLSEDVKELVGEVKKVCEIMKGNGKIGLVSKVEIMWKGWLWMLSAGGLAVLGLLVGKYAL